VTNPASVYPQQGIAMIGAWSANSAWAEVLIPKLLGQHEKPDNIPDLHAWPPLGSP
jgi:hypothetical protein